MCVRVERVGHLGVGRDAERLGQGGTKAGRSRRHLVPVDAHGPAPHCAGRAGVLGQQRRLTHAARPVDEQHGKSLVAGVERAMEQLELGGAPDEAPATAALKAVGQRRRRLVGGRASSRTHQGHDADGERQMRSDTNPTGRPVGSGDLAVDVLVGLGKPPRVVGAGQRPRHCRIWGIHLSGPAQVRAQRSRAPADNPSRSRATSRTATSRTRGPDEGREWHATLCLDAAVVDLAVAVAHEREALASLGIDDIRPGRKVEPDRRGTVTVDPSLTPEICHDDLAIA